MADKKAKTEDQPFMVNGHPYDPDTGRYLDGPHPEEGEAEAEAESEPETAPEPEPEPAEERS